MDFWFDRGTHFSNKSILHHGLWEVPQNIFPELETASVHYHTAKHGKTYVDGHFGYVSSTMDNYSTHNEGGIQSSQDICDAIQWGLARRTNPSPNITYIQINMDIDGPNSSESYMTPLKASNPIDTALKITQIKSLGHYTYHKALQGQDIDTTKEIDSDKNEFITLPSLDPKKTKNIDTILIQAKHIWSDDKTVDRRHGKRVVKATKPKVADKFVPIEPNIKEVDRQKKARDKLYKTQQLLAGKHTLIDDDIDEVMYDAKDDVHTVYVPPNNHNKGANNRKRKRETHDQSLISTVASPRKESKKRKDKKYKCFRCKRGFAYQGNREKHEKLNNCVGKSQ